MAGLGSEKYLPSGKSYALTEMDLNLGDVLCYQQRTISGGIPEAYYYCAPVRWIVLVQRIQDDLIKMIEARENVLSEVDANDATAAR